MTTHTKGTAELTTAMAISGTLGIFVVESGADPFTVVFFRCVFGALALGLYCLARGYLKAPSAEGLRAMGLTGKAAGLAVLGGVFIVFNWVFLFDAIERTSIGVATVVYHTQPFYVVLLGALLFRERITADKTGWLVIAFGGLVLVSGIGPSALTGGGRDGYLLGLGAALLAALFYAFATLAIKRIEGVRPHVIALVQALVGIPLLLPFADLAGSADLGAGWAWLAGLGAIHTGLMYILMYSAYQKLPLQRIAVLIFVYPAVALLADWAVYGHAITLTQLLGLPLIAAATLGVTLGRRLPLPRARKNKGYVKAC
ncbi:EamA family transporter [Streptomyces sp. A7024]|uniref:EamA family transporter n=1 Tax=Streptomyces coryli TaxID=1128680 RepID=A0A6G4UEK1_9ACTN|nr:DMT family transporter [Streptomyces coryli]NGN70256.1 EamA family transporter [Streptomyces coryli]